ncbi:MAG: hypothetical protein CDV28_101233 [Candidatus Electronema aureum]|uniref:Uncharacterized protein n=1 Tax=Candidatus Electronema aureum TaxID=2005002 RepID=A0A521G5N4_9BACT|nr:MAG: hypothetical protein CDV28_101233 [Candidatus Electronema aureum]
MIIIYNNLGLLWLLLAVGINIALQSAGIIIDSEGNYSLEIIAILIFLFDFCFRFLIRKNRKV